VQEPVKKRGSWKGAAIQRGLEHRRRGVSIFGTVTTSEDTASWKKLNVL
jgi:hypothetical protein